MIDREMVMQMLCNLGSLGWTPEPELLVVLAGAATGA